MYGQLGHFNGVLRAPLRMAAPPEFILIFVERQKLVAYNFALVAAVAQSVEQRIRKTCRQSKNLQSTRVSLD